MARDYMSTQLKEIRAGEPHYEAAQYVMRHRDRLTLLDFDSWAFLEDLCGASLSFMVYHLVDEQFDEVLIDYEGDREMECKLKDAANNILLNTPLCDEEDERCGN